MSAYCAKPRGPWLEQTRFNVWSPSLGVPEEAPLVFFAMMPSMAAENFVEQRDSLRDIARGNVVRVFVREKGTSDPPLVFDVSGQMVPMYDAIQLSAEKAEIL